MPTPRPTMKTWQYDKIPWGMRFVVLLRGRLRVKVRSAVMDSLPPETLGPLLGEMDATIETDDILPRMRKLRGYGEVTDADAE